MLLSIPPVWLWLHDQMLCRVSHSSSQLLTAGKLVELYASHHRQKTGRRKGEKSYIFIYIISKGQKRHTSGSTLDGEMVEIVYLLGQDHQMHFQSMDW